MASNRYKDYEIIDAHAHIFPQKISAKASSAIGDFYEIPMCYEGNSEVLLEKGKKINVSKYLVCSTATIPEQTEAINTFIADECKKHPQFFGFGTLHPNMDNMEAEIERIISLGLHGIKIHPDFQKFDIDDKKAFKLYELIESRLPILIHMGDERYDYSRPHKLVEVARKFPELDIIAAHFGGYQCWDEAADCLRLPNIKFDTCSTLAIIEPEKARKLIKHFGEDNFFFGTDFPMWDHEEELERFFNIGLSHEQNKKILSENFKKFFEL